MFVCSVNEHRAMKKSDITMTQLHMLNNDTIPINQVMCVTSIYVFNICFANPGTVCTRHVSLFPDLSYHFFIAALAVRYVRSLIPTLSTR